MICPTITAGYSAGVNAYGKTVDELQDGISIIGNRITGTLKGVWGYKGFDSSHEDKQRGHYLAMDFDAPEEATVTVEIIGGDRGPVELEVGDRSCVFLIRDKDEQKIRVQVAQDGKVWETIYDLSGLTFKDPVGEDAISIPMEVDFGEACGKAGDFCKDVNITWSGENGEVTGTFYKKNKGNAYQIPLQVCDFYKGQAITIGETYKELLWHVFLGDDEPETMQSKSAVVRCGESIIAKLTFAGATFEDKAATEE